jgi:hypothetical protein
MVENTVHGALTLAIVESFLQRTGSSLAYVQIAPADLAVLRSAGIVVDSSEAANEAALPVGLSIGGKALFADEKVPVNELLALDLNKQVIGVLTLATVIEVAGEKS